MILLLSGRLYININTSKQCLILLYDESEFNKANFGILIIEYETVCLNSSY
jgi:hypothetical protein